MVHSQVIDLRTRGNTDVVDVTDEVKGVVARAGITTGIAVAFVSHSTAAITTSEFEPALVKDLKEAFERLTPQDADYEHNHEYDDNGHAHIRASLLGPSISLPVEKGKIALGQWQSIVVLDFDNRARSRQVHVQVIGD